MTLKEQIEATIQAYELACKPENLNYEYCWLHDLHRGICYYSKKNNLDKLHELVLSKVKGWLVEAPFYYDDPIAEDIKEVHETRIRFLKNLLKQIK